MLLFQVYHTRLDFKGFNNNEWRYCPYELIKTIILGTCKMHCACGYSCKIHTGTLQPL